LELGQSGWDWFSLQLSDGTELMLFQLRTLLPGAKPMMSGSVIDKQGNVISLKSGDFNVTPGKVWNSNATGAKYPVEWQIEIPSRQIQLKLSTALESQEMRSEKAGPSYWEGAVKAAGTKAGSAVTAKGYLEMTGYSGASMRSFFAGPE
jgi:predicted secreted hydrolase